MQKRPISITSLLIVATPYLHDSSFSAALCERTYIYIYMYILNYMYQSTLYDSITYISLPYSIVSLSAALYARIYTYMCIH